MSNGFHEHRAKAEASGGACKDHVGAGHDHPEAEAAGLGGVSAVYRTMNVFQILVGVAGVLAVVSLVKPSWPLVPVGLLLVCVALLVGK